MLINLHLSVKSAQRRISKFVKMKRAGWVIEKTVRKAERAWFFDGRRGKRSLYPSSEKGDSPLFLCVFSKHPA
jgi:hypothetical protein